jgi:LPS sulfotransferase NodH
MNVRGIFGRAFMRYLLADKGLLRDHYDYARFIVVGRSRTGSNLLRSLLNAHSRVEAYGEVFRNPGREAMDWDHTGYLRQSDRMHRLLLDDPVKFIETRVFRRYPAEIAAVGFKIFYYHAQERSWQPVWPYLKQQTAIRVIHMKRRNMLSTHLSRKRAEITDVWVNTSGQAEQPVAVTLDYDQCLADFQRTRAWEETCDAQFASHPKIDLFYEDLAQDNDREMRRVQQFLGLDYQPVAPAIYKQSQQTLAEAIANYDDLRGKFTGTPWAAFFADGDR